MQLRISTVLFSLCFSFFYSIDAAASPRSVTQTQTQLKHLETQIHTLQNKLSNAKNKHDVLNKELANTEKQIGEGINKLHSIQNDISFKERKIAALQDKITDMSQQLTTQQLLLANHVRARYQMGEYEPLKWVINQDNPYKISRIMTYYQYLVLSRQNLIRQINETRKNLKENKETLHIQLMEKKQLKLQLTAHQDQLEQNKRYNNTVLDSLNSEIKNNEHALSDYQRDKENLSRILESLAKESITPKSKPFNQMRKKLPFPIQTDKRSLRRMNQGVTFFADEGTVVTAVYPGKVVFSDWLKGYGLLLIIDHGQGFMTLYAHNQSLFKNKGEMVYQNEQVASVGHSGGIKQNGLYFEIRLRGKAVSPFDWMS